MEFRVLVNDRPVGWIHPRGTGSEFTYDEGVQPKDAVSLTMPVRKKPYTSGYGLPLGLSAHLPEGSLHDFIKDQITKSGDLTDELSILAVTGSNQIGRVKAIQPDAEPRVEPHIEDLDDILNEKVTPATARKFLNEFGINSGVSGFMPKVLISPDSKGTGNPHPISSVDHIIKFEVDRLPCLALNEFCCIKASHLAGNNSASARLNVEGNILAVKRFDGTPEHRLGFDDFCTLNRMSSNQKFSGTIQHHLFKAIEQVGGAKNDQNMEDMFRQCVTNFALRNGDAHLKNFAVLYDDAHGGPVNLSPAYDIVTTAIYELEDTLALPISKSNKSLKWPKPDDVVKMGEFAGLSPENARHIMDEVGAGIRQAIPEMLDTFNAHEKADWGVRMESAWKDGLRNSLDIDLSTHRSRPAPRTNNNASQSAN